MLHHLLMVISLAQMPLTCVKFWPLQVMKGDNFADWLRGCPQALIQQRHVWSVHVGLANGTKHFHKTWGNLLSELHAPHKQCVTSISNAFSDSFTSIWPFLILLPVSGLFWFFYQYLALFSTVSLDPNKSMSTLCYTRRHLLTAVPWISKARLSTG